jgi:hypothetical protein
MCILKLTGDSFGNSLGLHFYKLKNITIILRKINTIIDLDRDIWTYVSMEYFNKKSKLEK